MPKKQCLRSENRCRSESRPTRPHSSSSMTSTSREYSAKHHSAKSHSHRSTRKSEHVSRKKMNRSRNKASLLDQRCPPGAPNMSIMRDGFPLPGNVTLQRSSIDDLLGIDAMEMYNPRTDSLYQPSCQFAPHRKDDPMWNATQTLVDPFQRKCLRSLASMIMCPHTVLPVLVGLFTRSKLLDETIYLQTLSDELAFLSTKGSPGLQIETRRFPFCASLLPLWILLLIGYILGLTLSWQLGLAVAATATIVYLILCSTVFFTSHKRSKSKSSRFEETLSRYARGCNLILKILFCKAPAPMYTHEPVRLLPISIDLAESSGPVDAAAMMAEKVWSFVEQKYGKVAVRLQWACKEKFGCGKEVSRKFCCFPIWLWFGTCLLSALVTATLVTVQNVASGGQKIGKPSYIKASMITCAALCSLSSLVLIFTSISSVIRIILGRPFQHASQRERIKKPGRMLEIHETGCYGGLKMDTDFCLNSCNYAQTTKLGTASAISAACNHRSRSQTRRSYENQSSSQMNSSDDEALSSNSENDDVKFSEQLRSNKRLFESEEFLIHENKRKKRLKKESQLKTPVNLDKLKNLLSSSLLEAFKVLSMIDARMGGRQTRIVLCVNTGISNGNHSPHLLINLATFVRLIDRLLFQQKSTESRKESNSKAHKKEQQSQNPVSWTPNLVMILSSPVPYCEHRNAADVRLQPRNTKDWRRLERHIYKNPMPWTNIRIWFSIHSLCHLPIYLEDAPPCQDLVDPQAQPSPERSAKQARYPASRSVVPPVRNILAILTEDHELVDMNRENLRSLLTMFAFMGRMINSDRLCHRPTDRTTVSSVSSDALIAWLCLLVHWPFHAAWLAMFVGEHFKAKSTPRHGSGAERPDETDIHGDEISLESLLCHLHKRVLKKLAAAIESAKKLALESAMRHSSKPGKEDTASLSQILSTLEICDLAQRDHDPRRLGEYLRPPERERIPSGSIHRSLLTVKPSRAGSVSVLELVRVMKLTPFLNPQIIEWMKDLSSTKPLEKSARKQTPPSKRGSQNLNIQRTLSYSARLDRNTPSSRPSSQTRVVGTCPVKMMHGLPSKDLKQLTVEEVCELTRNIADISFNRKHREDCARRSRTLDNHKLNSSGTESLMNDPNPPSSIKMSGKTSERKKSMDKKYAERIKQLNLTGNVLSICSLEDLQKELGMSFGDWQLFSALIHHMRTLQSTQPKVSKRQSRSLRSINKREIDVCPNQPGGMNTPGFNPVVGTVSDTSLALTVRSAPISEPKSHLHEPKQKFTHQDTAKSMIEIDHTTDPRIVYCHQHRVGQHYPIRGNLRLTKPRLVYCPKHRQGINHHIQNTQMFYTYPKKPTQTALGTQWYPVPVEPDDSELTRTTGSHMGQRSHHLTDNLTEHRSSTYVPSLSRTKPNYSHAPEQFGITGNKKESRRSKMLEVTDPQVPGTDPQANESSSTSIAGEMVEEVVEFTPTHDQIHQYPTQADQTKVSATEEHLCNCNYWYSLEKLGTGDMQRTDTRSVEVVQQPLVDHNAGVVMYDSETSLSDSLSSTKSQLEMTSGTNSENSSSVTSVEMMHS